MSRPIDAEALSKAIRDYFVELIEMHIYEIDVVDCNAGIQKLITEQPECIPIECDDSAIKAAGAIYSILPDESDFVIPHVWGGNEIWFSVDGEDFRATIERVPKNNE